MEAAIVPSFGKTSLEASISRKLEKLESNFGDSCSAHQECCLVQVCLRSQYGGKVYFIEAIEMPFICRDVIQVPVENEFVKAMEDGGQPIADKLFLPGMPVVPRIELLIGADHLWKFMTGKI